MTGPSTLAEFADCRGDTFLVRDEAAGDLALVLSEVRALPSHRAPASVPSRREPFALLFHGPREVLLPQRIYRFEHERLGAFEMFIVPLGPDERGHRYEAIFN